MTGKRARGEPAPGFLAGEDRFPGPELKPWVANCAPSRQDLRAPGITCRLQRAGQAAQFLGIAGGRSACADGCPVAVWMSRCKGRPRNWDREKGHVLRGPEVKPTPHSLPACSVQPDSALGQHLLETTPADRALAGALGPLPIGLVETGRLARSSGAHQAPLT